MNYILEIKNFIKEFRLLFLIAVIIGIIQGIFPAFKEMGDIILYMLSGAFIALSVIKAKDLNKNDSNT